MQEQNTVEFNYNEVAFEVIASNITHIAKMTEKAFEKYVK
ncbi:6691_t:CDS:2 [Diversispora eburnea]|uniref:6691_t:CDS:1 n=1 Tax=Diversispora eburnea TaxID=1213867 RepID=A0A9N8V144_9GLOM|nr:6691_t:CDS:2 [Diversispora eburnea]